MPIKRLLREGKITPEEAERLDRAYSFTLRSLSLVDRNDPVSEIIARKVIEIDAAGTHDPEEIAKLAMKSLAFHDKEPCSRSVLRPALLPAATLHHPHSLAGPRIQEGPNFGQNPAAPLAMV